MELQNIPEHIAYLMLLYMHAQLNSDQHDELDEWVVASNENMELFAAATDEKRIRLAMLSKLSGLY
jgi:hypothetical protein